MVKKKSKVQTDNWFEKILSRPYHSIILICLLLYVQVITFGLVHFDDHGFVLMGSDTLKLSNIPAFFRHSVFWVLGDTTQDTDVFYRPLQNVVYAVCNTIAAKQAWIYHFFGVVLHALTCCVLFRFFTMLKYQASTALVFTLIYAVHPVLVQGVAWIAGVGDQMAALFCLLSIIYFMKDPGPKGGSQFATLSFKYGFLHLVFLCAALFSKEISIALIPICLFRIFLFPNAERKSLPFRGWGLAFGWIVIVVVYFIFRNSAIHPPKTNLLVSAFESFRVNGPLLFEYFEKMFLPHRLSPIPSREDAQVLIGLIVFVTLIFFFIFKKRFTRMTLFGALWFLVFLLPSFIQQNPQAHFFAFEHRLYLPLIGIVIIMMELVGLVEWNMRSNFQKYGFALVLVVFSALTFSHSRTFKDPYTFYDKALASSPKSVIAYNGYGKLLLEDEKYAEAIEAFKKSHQYKPDDLQTTGKIADLYLKNLNDPQQAIVWFKKTLEIAPNSIEAAVSIGDAYFNFLRDTTNAIAAYENALRIDPKNEFAAASLGVIYVSKGKNEGGRSYLSLSLNSNPKNLLALKWMAISYFNEGKIPDAVEYLTRGFESYPQDVDFQRNLMICYYKLNDKTQTERFAALLSKTNNAIPAEIDNYLKGNK